MKRSRLAVMVMMFGAAACSGTGADRALAPRADTASAQMPVITDGLQSDGEIHAPQRAPGDPLVNEPLLRTSAYAGIRATGTAVFGPSVTGPVGNVFTDAPIVHVTEGLITHSVACEPLTTNLTGAVALIERGPCFFVTKAKNAEDAGAIGVIIYDNAFSSIPPTMGAPADAPTVTIPVVSVTRAVGFSIRSFPGPIGTLETVAGEAPVLHMPSPIVVDATSRVTTPVRYSVTADDNSGVVFGSCQRGNGAGVPTGGTVGFPLGMTTVTCTVSDVVGNQTAGSFTVTVLDDPTPPTIVVPSTITTEATGPDGAVVSFAVEFTDNVRVRASSCSAHTGATFPIGTTVVACTATDQIGNTATASFEVRVVDTTAPSLSVPTDFVVDATSPAGATVEYAATATDAVGVIGGVSCTPAGFQFAIGTTTVSCSASDAAGNVSTGAFTVKVKSAPEQIVDLIEFVRGTPIQDAALRAKLVSLLQLALTDIANRPAGCMKMSALVSLASNPLVKPRLGVNGDEIIVRLTRIKAVVGC